MRSHLLKIHFVLPVLAGLILTTFAALPRAAAQCSPRTDWNIYTVTRGDNLYRISLRFNTTVSVLAQGNCLINPSLLYAGQQLRVPPTGGIPLPYVPPVEPPGYTADIGSTQQAFENGFMTWRADSGVIWVFFNNGQLQAIPSSTYGRLSGSAQYTIPIPAGRNLPSQGFKKVYDNFPDIRAALGWAIGGEQGFLMGYQTDTSGNIFITLASGSPVKITPYGNWSYTGTVPPPQPTPIPPTPAPLPEQWTTGATFQPYERGFMVWRADNGEIRVYAGSTANGGNGSLTVYSSYQYGYLPPNVPEFLYAANSGFGKVWHFIPGVRDNLGNATQPELGYTMNLKQANGVVTSFTLPDGRTVTNQGNDWVIGG